MHRKLVSAIKDNMEILFTNGGIMLETCDLDFILCDFPVWKHVYHMFHSCDQWIINPKHYTEPDFHEPNMNSLNIMTEKVLTRGDLTRYLKGVKIKVMNYLDGLTDEMLYEMPQNCPENRLSLILMQIRHFYRSLTAEASI